MPFETMLPRLPVIDAMVKAIISNDARAIVSTRYSDSAYVFAVNYRQGVEWQRAEVGAAGDSNETICRNIRSIAIELEAIRHA